MAEWDVVSTSPISKDDEWAVKSREPIKKPVSSLSLEGAVDVARSLPGGLAKGVSAIAGMPGDIVNSTHNSGIRFANNEAWKQALDRPEAAIWNLPDNIKDTVTSDLGNTVQQKILPDTQSINETISKPFGGYYQPKTFAGRVAETAASFAPALLGGEASIPARIATRMVAPAIGSEAAGEATKGTSLEPWARVGGALAGGGAFAGLKSGGTKAINAMRGIEPNAEDIAQQYVSKLANASGQTPETIEAFGAAHSGKGPLAAEALGPTGVANMATLGRKSGVTADQLSNTLLARSQEAPNRMLGDYAQASGINPSAAHGDLQDLLRTGRAEAAPLYEKALSAPATTTAYLDRLASDPVIQQGMQKGIKIERLQSLADNKPFDPAGYAITHFNEAGDPVIGAVPTWKTWDAAKTGLDDMLNSYRNPITGKLELDKTGTAINNVRLSLLKELDSVNPAYKAARARSGDYLSAQEAFNKGQNSILSSGTTAKQVADYVKNLSGSNLEAYKGGIANKLFLQAQNGRLNPKFVNIPAVQQKLVAALGPNNAMKFISNIQKEFALGKSGARMMPGTNSITSDVLLNSGEMDNAANLAAGVHAARSVGHAAQGNIFGAIPSGIAAARHFFPDLMKTGGMPPEVRDAAGRLMMSSPEDFAAILRQNPPQNQALSPWVGRMAPLFVPNASIYGRNTK